MKPSTAYLPDTTLAAKANMPLTDSPSRRRLLLVGWDGADWKVISPLMDKGEMPHLQKLVERGVMGELATLTPTLSPVLWNSIATGKRADQHGILGFSEIDPRSGEVRPVSSLSRRAKAFWNILSQAGRRVRVVNWFGSHPAEPINGVCVSDTFTRGTDSLGPMPSLAASAVHPASLADEFASLRVGIREIDGQMLTLFVPRASDVDQAKDHRLVDIARELAKTASIHTATTRLLADDDWDLVAAYYPSIDLLCHGFMKFHPPQLAGIPDTLFELYHDVVNSTYRFHDLMLGRLLQLAGPDTTVLLLSDHGFHSDHLRPARIPNVPAGITVEHRSHGVFLLAGPGIKPDERIYGLNLLDIAPTLLWLFGVPVGRDMAGRVLTETFTAPPPVDWVESWENIPGNAGQHGPGVVLDPEDQTVLLNQFVALGYLDALETDLEKARAQTRRENQWNLARSHLSTGRLDLAIPLLEELCQAWPERADMALGLAECLRGIGLHEPAGAIAEAMIADHRDTPQARYLLGVTALDAGRFEEAFMHLAAAEPAFPRHPDLLVRLGIAYQRLANVAAAERSFKRATEVDPGCAPAWLGLAGCAFSRRRWAEALEWAVHAAGLDFQLARAHWLAGLVFWRQGEIEKAIRALETAVRVQPGFLLPRRLLIRLWLTQPNGLEKARQHQEAWREGRRMRAALDQQQAEMLTAARQEACGPHCLVAGKLVGQAVSRGPGAHRRWSRRPDAESPPGP